jgi:hypothetical protein
MSNIIFQVSSSILRMPHPRRSYATGVLSHASRLRKRWLADSTLNAREEMALERTTEAQELLGTLLNALTIEVDSTLDWEKLKGQNAVSVERSQECRPCVGTRAKAGASGSRPIRLEISRHVYSPHVRRVHSDVSDPSPTSGRLADNFRRYGGVLVSQRPPLTSGGRRMGEVLVCQTRFAQSPSEQG